MDDKNVEVKDWIGAEKWLAEMVEQARANAKRWFIISIILLAALVATNAYWIYTFQSYEYIAQDGDGINNINSGSQGDVVNEPESKAEEEWEK